MNLKIKKPIFIILILIMCTSLCLTLFYSKSAIQAMTNEHEECINLPIIMYHSILKTNKCNRKFIVSPNIFEEDLKYLTDNGYSTIVMNDLLNYVFDNKSLPEKPIMLTFDDGYYNNYFYAFPLLKKYNCKMVLSVVGKLCDMYTENKDCNPNYAYCSWDHLKEMNSSGLVEIQNHSYNMHTISKNRYGTKKNPGENIEHYEKIFGEDVTLMQNKLKENLNITSTTFVYPFGGISNCSLDILKQLGFKATFDCEGKVNKFIKNPDNLFNLHRILRPPNVSSKVFFSEKIN